MFDWILWISAIFFDWYIIHCACTQFDLKWKIEFFAKVEIKTIEEKDDWPMDSIANNKMEISYEIVECNWIKVNGSGNENEGDGDGGG